MADPVLWRRLCCRDSPSVPGSCSSKDLCIVSCGGPAMRQHLLTRLIACCGNAADKADRIAERAILKDKAEILKSTV